MLPIVSSKGCHARRGGLGVRWATWRHVHDHNTVNVAHCSVHLLMHGGPGIRRTSRTKLHLDFEIPAIVPKGLSAQCDLITQQAIRALR